MGHAESKIKEAKNIISKKHIAKQKNTNSLIKQLILTLDEIIQHNEWTYKKGKNAEIMPLDISERKLSLEDAQVYYESFFKSSYIKKFIDRYTFKKTAQSLNIDYQVYRVKEVGYKLSKRKEKAKPNQLITFRSTKKELISNLHLCDEEYVVHVNKKNPKVILDYIKRDIKWS